MEGEISEFLVKGNGWTQHATERVRVRLRDKQGQILWEAKLEAEDGGMDSGYFAIQKSMNVAFDRLLTKATEEFNSEFFYQSVKKLSTVNRVAKRSDN